MTESTNGSRNPDEHVATLMIVWLVRKSRQLCHYAVSTVMGY